MPAHAAFFYGTLLHPAILRRVIGHDGDDMQICPAILPEHTRHHVKYADYPGVIPYAKARELLGKDLTPEERVVRGTVVTGLSDEDIEYLDVFEGNEYTREFVTVHPLSDFVPLYHSAKPDSDTVPTRAPALPSLDSLSETLTVQTYMWTHPLNQLHAALWDYNEFVKENSHKWIGAGAVGNGDILEVDKRRAMNGNIVRRAIVEDPDHNQDNVIVISEKI